METIADQIWVIDKFFNKKYITFLVDLIECIASKGFLAEWEQLNYVQSSDLLDLWRHIVYLVVWYLIHMPNPQLTMKLKYSFNVKLQSKHSQNNTISE